MSNTIAIAYSCEIARDPAQNTANHDELVSDMRREMFRAGWTGCKVTRFQQQDGKSYVEIEAGVSALTLDYLRAFKAPAPPLPVSEQSSQPQGRLL